MSNENEVKALPFKEWRERVQKELTRLTERIVCLRQFMASEEFQDIDARQRDLLTAQSTAMCRYADILTQRLRAETLI